MTTWSGNARSRLKNRHRLSNIFRICCTLTTYFGVAVLIILLYGIAKIGFEWIDTRLINNMPSQLFPEKAGVKSALWGTVWLIGLTALISIPIGVAAAIYLEEYSRKGKVSTLIEINISNLAGVPSIVYGILGLVIFARWVGAGDSLITGALTMSLLVLPVVITASREAIKAVPPLTRQAAFAVGGTRWQTVWHHVLPASLPGVITGVILSLSRAMGETAPLIIIGAATFLLAVPSDPFNDSFSALPLQIYDWTSQPKEIFHQKAAAAILVLLAVLLFMNAIAVFIRHRYQRKTL